MADREPTDIRNLSRYGQPPIPWSRAREALQHAPSQEFTQFLGTARADGTPHSAGLAAQWLDGELFFTSSPGARKARDLAENPRCTLSGRFPGIDLVLEGTAVRVTDGPTLAAVAAGYNAVGWPAEVVDDAFTAPYNAPSAGPPPYHVYRFDYRTVFGVGPEGATRWRF